MLLAHLNELDGTRERPGCSQRKLRQREVDLELSCGDFPRRIIAGFESAGLHHFGK